MSSVDPPEPSVPPGRRVPLERQLPPEVHASPTQMPPGEDDGIFWLPNFGESLRYVGWRWVLVLPAVAVVGLLVSGLVFDLHLLNILWYAGFKLVILAVSVPAVMFASAVRKAVQNRSDPFCIHCGYGLTGLPDGHQCPECGRPFTFALIQEYRRDPHWFIRRYKTRHQIPTSDVPFMAGAVTRKKSRDGT